MAIEQLRHGPPKRFYKTVAIKEEAAGFCVILDGRSVRTPLKSILSLPTRLLAEAIAEEWDAQLETIDLMMKTGAIRRSLAILFTDHGVDDLAIEHD